MPVQSKHFALESDLATANGDEQQRRQRRRIGARPATTRIGPCSSAGGDGDDREEEAHLRAVGAEQHVRAGRRAGEPLGRRRAVCVRARAVRRPPPVGRRPLGGRARAPPRRHRHGQDLRRRPRHGLRQRPPPPPPCLLLVGDRPRPLRRRRHRHPGVGAGDPPLRPDGAEGDGGRRRRRGAPGGAVVPGRERRHRARGPQVSIQHGEADQTCAIRSQFPRSTIHPGESHPFPKKKKIFFFFPVHILSIICIRYGSKWLAGFTYLCFTIVLEVVGKCDN